MKSSIKFRKLIHIILFFLIILLQFRLYYYWKIQNENKEKLSQAFIKLDRPNYVMQLSNKATSYYFEADNYFNKYLQEYNPEMLSGYKNSLKKMSETLDSLAKLTKGDYDLVQIVQSKEITAIQMAKIKKRLDSLIGSNLISYKPDNYILKNNLNSFKTYDSQNVINSISYDTIRHEIETPEKKGLFGRLGNALSGKEGLAKQTVEIRITMKLGGHNETGSFIDQLSRLTNDINNFYDDKFKQNNKKFQQELQTTYKKLQNKDKEIIAINENILNNSKEIINFYSNTAYSLNNIRQKKFINQYNMDIEKQNKNIQNILIALTFITLLLLVYTLIANSYENKLQKAKKIAEQNDELKTRILGMLSHEMRAPLNIISNKSAQLKESIHDKNLINTINSISFNSNSLNLTVNQILDFIKNENSKLTFYNANFILNDQIEAIIESLKTLAEIKNIELILNTDSNTKQLIWADNVKIYQLFYNLIGNSIKFTDKGKIVVDSSLEKYQGKLKYNVKISDTGAGIPEEDLSKIFNKFYQSKNPNLSNSLGAGLGLNLCKEIIELYDGEITITSKIGTGTIISFYMLFDFPIDESLSNKEKLIYSDKIKNQKVAIVDDDIFMRQVIKNLLEDINFKVFEFDSSKKILNFLNQEEVNLIITDIELPEISGLELVNLVRNSTNKNVKTPVIAITGDYTFNENKINENKINDYLIKPVNPEEFYIKIYDILTKI